MENDRAEFATTERHLRSEVLELSRALDDAPKPMEVEALTEEVTALQKAVLDYQSKYEEAKRKHRELKLRYSAGGSGGFEAGGGAGGEAEVGFSYAHAMANKAVRHCHYLFPCSSSSRRSG
jgi:hypothetical protein